MFIVPRKRFFSQKSDRIGFGRLDISFDADSDGILLLVVLASGVECFLLFLVGAQEWHDVRVVAYDAGR